jgi:uncharacterized protein (DUF1501 family)
MSISRRSLIRNASLVAAGNVMGFRPFGIMNSLAQTTSSYKALVCIFLFGGNDSNNTIIPFDTAGYQNYASVRGPLAIAQNSLLPLTPLPTFALNPNLQAVQSLINSGNVAIVANVGTLIQPTTRSAYLAHQVTTPTNLFSHPDQQLEWQNASQSAATQTGWAGRIADALNVQYNVNAQIPMIASVAGDTLFCNGSSTSPASVSPGNLGNAACSEGTECAGRLATAQQLVSFSTGVSLVQADNQITSNSYNIAAALTAATAGVPALSTTFPANNGLASQLKQIAQLIQVRSALGVERQIFFAGVGNFDTHSTQLTLQNNLLAQVSAAMGAFYQATVELGVQNQVTAFTMSDFSRTFQPNSNTGSDHAWGAHHLVMGGAVQGGKMYGSFPTLALGGPDDSGSNGRWVPSTASTQYAATLAQWFGVSAAQLPSVFPYIGNFSTNNLGFV